MKIDLDCIRYILLKIEEIEDSNPKITVEDLKNDEYNPETISGHIAFLCDDNYIDAKSTPIINKEYKSYIVHRITASGNRYLDTVRDISVWGKIKKKMKETASPGNFASVLSIASTLASLN